MACRQDHTAKKLTLHAVTKPEWRNWNTQRSQKPSRRGGLRVRISPRAPQSFEVAQLEEQLPVKESDAGSNPALGAIRDRLDGKTTDSESADACSNQAPGTMAVVAQRKSGSL